jgi:hypothetical protein
MKDFFNVFITIILCGIAIGIAYLQYNQQTSLWGALFLPWIGFSIAWGVKIHRDYKNQG